MGSQNPWCSFSRDWSLLQKVILASIFLLETMAPTFGQTKVGVYRGGYFWVLDSNVREPLAPYISLLPRVAK